MSSRNNTHLLINSFTIIIITSILSNNVVNSLGMIGGNLCNTNDGSVLIQEIAESKDATIFQGQDLISSGEDSFLVGSTRNGIRRGLLKFDIQQDDFPPDAQVECTEVRLHVFESDNESNKIPEITLHRVTSDWKTSGENRVIGTNGGTVKLGDVTWLYTDYPQSIWREKGGDFAENIIATKKDFGEVHSYGNTLQMARIVQDWIDLYGGTFPFNAGFMLVGEENVKGDKYVRYNGIENAPDLIPRLIVTYTSPSQGIEHRDYTGYISETPMSPSFNSRSGVVVDILIFIGGMAFCGLIFCFVTLLQKIKKKNQPSSPIETAPKTDLQFNKKETPIDIAEPA